MGNSAQPNQEVCTMPEARCVGRQAMELAENGETAALGYVAALCAGCPFLEQPAPPNPDILGVPESPAELVEQVRRYTHEPGYDRAYVSHLWPGGALDRVRATVNLEPYMAKLGIRAVERTIERVARHVVAVELSLAERADAVDGLPATEPLITPELTDGAILTILDDALTLADQKVGSPDRQATYRSPAQVDALRAFFQNDTIITSTDIATCLHTYPIDALARLARLKINYTDWIDQYRGLFLHSPKRFKEICLQGAKNDIEAWAGTQRWPDIPTTPGRALQTIRRRLDMAELTRGEVSLQIRRHLETVLEKRPAIRELKERLGDRYDSAVNNFMRLAMTANSEEKNLYLDIDRATAMAIVHLRDIADMADMGIRRPGQYALKFSAKSLQQLIDKYGQATHINRATGKERPILSRADMIRLLNQRNDPVNVEQIFAGFVHRIELGRRLFGNVLSDSQIRTAATESVDAQGFMNGMLRAASRLNGEPDPGWREELLARARLARRLQSEYADSGLNPDLIALVVATEQDPLTKIRQLIDEHLYGDFSDGETATTESPAETASHAAPPASGVAHSQGTVGEIKAVVSAAVAGLETMDAQTEEAASRFQEIAGTLLELMGVDHPAGAEIQRALDAGAGHLRTKAELIRAAQRYLTTYTDSI